MESGEPWQGLAMFLELPVVLCLVSGGKDRPPGSAVSLRTIWKDASLSTHFSVDRKYGSNGGQAVNVRRSIQGIKADHILALNHREEHPVSTPTHHHNGT